MTFEEQHEIYLAQCNQGIAQAIAVHFQPGSVVSQAAEYSLLNGGKRVRGVLALGANALLHGEEATAALYAAAVEMIHAFSLIHDDMPCMDDDDTRRGKPACHIAFGQANALLAGDLLSIAAFATLAGAPGPAVNNAHAVQILAEAAGTKGMIYGQELDMLAEKTSVDETGLHAIHRYKTGALISGAVQLGIAAAGPKPSLHPTLLRYAQNIGTVFQIIDDILDVTADETALGKPVGSDNKNGKTTYVSLYGIEKASQMAAEQTRQAVEGLQSNYGPDAWFLCQFAENLLKRVC